MAKTTTNFYRDWQEHKMPGGEIWRFVDLSGKHIGARIEDLAPNDTSSVHHFHTLEEEHVLVLDGAATLFFGTEEIPLEAGDHVWFEAGEEVPHHILNTSDQPFRFLVFGERKRGDVVFYPEERRMFVKTASRNSYRYEPMGDDESGD